GPPAAPACPRSSAPPAPSCAVLPPGTSPARTCCSTEGSARSRSSACAGARRALPLRPVMMRQLPGDPRWIDEIPAVQAALRPHAPALAQGALRWSYVQWEAAVAAATEALTDEGLRAGDRMMI